MTPESAWEVLLDTAAAIADAADEIGNDDHRRGWAIDALESAIARFDVTNDLPARAVVSLMEAVIAMVETEQYCDELDDKDEEEA